MPDNKGELNIAKADPKLLKAIREVAGLLQANSSVDVHEKASINPKVNQSSKSR